MDCGYPSCWLIAVLKVHGIGYCMRVEKAGNWGIACFSDFLRSGKADQIVTLSAPPRRYADVATAMPERIDITLRQKFATPASTTRQPSSPRTNRSLRADFPFSETTPMGTRPGTGLVFTCHRLRTIHFPNIQFIGKSPAAHSSAPVRCEPGIGKAHTTQPTYFSPLTVR